MDMTDETMKDFLARDAELEHASIAIRAFNDHREMGLDVLSSGIIACQIVLKCILEEKNGS